jgi:hypothetical protein
MKGIASRKWIMKNALSEADDLIYSVAMRAKGRGGLVRNEGLIATLSLILMIGSFASAPAIAFAQTGTTTATSTPVIVHTNAGVEAQVRSYFAATPVMIAIAGCESGFREFDKAGKPLNGGSGNMIGVYQISARVHAAEARALGMNIHTVQGNLAYAEHLYAREGTVPWVSSSACWGPLTSADHASSTLSVATSSAAMDKDGQVAALQSQVTSLQTMIANMLKERTSSQNS